MKTLRVEVQFFCADGGSDRHNEVYRNSFVSAPKY